MLSRGKDEALSWLADKAGARPIRQPAGDQGVTFRKGLGQGKGCRTASRRVILSARTQSPPGARLREDRLPTRINRQFVEGFLSPFDHQETATGSWKVASAGLAEDDSSFEYAFTGSDLRVRFEPRSPRPCFLQTRCFNIVTLFPDGRQDATPEERRFLRDLARTVPGCEPKCVVWHRVPTLYLVPGALSYQSLGNLPPSAREVLDRVPIIIVERGKDRVAARLFEQLGIASDSKQFLAAPDTPQEAQVLVDALARGDDDGCFFGVDEGLPGFCDPGRDLLVALNAQPARLRVRTIDGSSALAMALLRFPLHLERFVFLGATNDDPVPALVERLKGGAELPVLYFLTGDALSTARRIVEACAPFGAEVMVACNLTREDEWHATFGPGDSLDELGRIDDQTRAVLAVHTTGKFPPREGQAKPVLRKLRAQESRLAANVPVPVFLGDDWPRSIPVGPGLYVVWDRRTGRPVCLGEAPGLRARWRDLGPFGNPAVRSAAAVLLNLANPSDADLRESLSRNFEVTTIVIELGRIEFWEYLTLRWRETLIDRPSTWGLEPPWYGRVEAVPASTWKPRPPVVVRPGPAATARPPGRSRR